MPNTFVSYEPVDVFRVVHTALYHAPLFAHRVSSSANVLHTRRNGGRTKYHPPELTYAGAYLGTCSSLSTT